MLLDYNLLRKRLIFAAVPDSPLGVRRLADKSKTENLKLKWYRGRVARLSSAKAATAVRIRSIPLKKNANKDLLNLYLAGLYFFNDAQNKQNEQSGALPDLRFDNYNSQR